MAELSQPSILWIEEVDFIAKSKDKDLYYGFQNELDNFSAERAVIIATTNKLDSIDKAMRRGGRLDIDIRMDMPSSEDRLSIFAAHLERIENASITDGELLIISRAASGFVSSDLA